MKIFIPKISYRNNLKCTNQCKILYAFNRRSVSVQPEKNSENSIFIVDYFDSMSVGKSLFFVTNLGCSVNELHLKAQNSIQLKQITVLYSIQILGHPPHEKRSIAKTFWEFKNLS